MRRRLLELPRRMLYNDPSGRIGRAASGSQHDVALRGSRGSYLPTRSGSGAVPNLMPDAKSIPKREEASLLGVLA